MSLRARLLIGLVMLVAAGLGAAAIVTYEEQRSFLLDRVRQQVEAAFGPVGFSLGVRGNASVPPVGTRRPPALPGARFPAPRGSTFEPSGTYGILVDSGRHITREVPFAYGQRAPSPPALPSRYPVTKFAPSRGVQVFTIDSRAGSSLRYMAAAIAIDKGRLLVVAVPLREVDQTLQRLIIVEVLVGAAVIVALIALGWVVIRLGLRPLERMGRVASEIAHGDFSRRVSPSNNRTEVGRLGSSLNEMLVRIEQAFADRRESEERLRQFLADASHELRTPLSSIRGYAELFRIGAADDRSKLDRAMSRIESEAARMGVLVEDLLMLARLDQLPEVRRVPVDLRELARHAAEDARAAAPSRRINLSTDGPVGVLADPDQLRQVLANLMRNAVIHTPRTRRSTSACAVITTQRCWRCATTAPAFRRTPATKCSSASGAEKGDAPAAEAAPGWDSLSSKRSSRRITARFTRATPLKVELCSR